MDRQGWGLLVGHWSMQPRLAPRSLTRQTPRMGRVLSAGVGSEARYRRGWTGNSWVTMLELCLYEVAKLGNSRHALFFRGCEKIHAADGRPLGKGEERECIPSAARFGQYQVGWQRENRPSAPVRWYGFNYWSGLAATECRSIRSVPCQQCDLTWLQIQSSSSALHTCSRQYINNLTTMSARSCMPGTMLGVMCDGLDIAVMGETIYLPCLAKPNPRLARPYSTCFLLSSRRRVYSVRQGG